MDSDSIGSLLKGYEYWRNRAERAEAQLEAHQVARAVAENKAGKLRAKLKAMRKDAEE